LQERYQKRKQDEEKRAREEDERLQQLLGLSAKAGRKKKERK
jgi:hypothetical protein